MDAARSLTMEDVSLPLRLGGPAEDGVVGLVLSELAVAVDELVRFSADVGCEVIGGGGGGVIGRLATFSLDFDRAPKPSSLRRASAVSGSISCRRCEPELAPRSVGAGVGLEGKG
jgi:hypothetical protein